MKNQVVLCTGDFTNHLSTDKPIVPIKGQKYTIMEINSGSDALGVFMGFILKEIPIYFGIDREKRFWNSTGFQIIDGPYIGTWRTIEDKRKPGYVQSNEVREEKPSYMV